MPLVRVQDRLREQSTKIIEVSLKLRLDSFFVNSMGKSEDLSSQMPAKALKLSRAKIGAVRRLMENKPSADFEFLGSAGKATALGESDREFDEKLFDYLTTHATVDISKANIASGSSGYIATPKAIKLLPGALVGHSEDLFVAGVLSCSLQFAPND